MNMKLTIVHPATLECAGEDVSLEPGVEVDYLGHVPGGNVLVRYNGKEGILNPYATKELQ